jgi:hypothetical protein
MPYNDFHRAFEEGQRPVSEVEEESAAHVAATIEELWERPATKEEQDWGRQYVRRLHNKSLGLRLPNLDEMHRELGLPVSPVLRRRLWGRNA